MHKMGTAVAALALAAAGLTGTATTAQAENVRAQEAGCSTAWPGRDGYVRAWKDVNCGGTLLGATQGNDANWADGSGAFSGSDNDNASSVMNSGYLGGRDVVAFYIMSEHRDESGYGCLAPGELYADWLGDNYYYSSTTGRTDISMENSISSHLWVYSSGCSSSSWIT
ncbi:hypothetical protein [Actinomadura sp. HBU206391]|uniref:hypothetical protein n=1 Tax=Actinomadura sp. HBU206391 TaxID=2731692 RepID=UPI00164EFC87|nr:hypothetical protein [Actinomadura sp. HBU206391]MBC6458608.1 hypothetical protein [Actinomadura sp. HBU206391]